MTTESQRPHVGDGARRTYPGPSGPLRLDPNTSPGGLVFVVLVDGTEIRRTPVTMLDAAEHVALADADAWNRALAAGTVPEVRIFDGDTGRMLGTFVPEV